MLPKEGILRPKTPRSFPQFMLFATAQTVSFPHEMKAKMTIQDGGQGGATSNTATASGAGRGGDAGVQWVTLRAGIPYTFLPGAAGAANAAGTNLSPTAGGVSSVTMKSGPTFTAAASAIYIPGADPYNSGNGAPGYGGSAFLGSASAGAGKGYGGAGAGAAGGAIGFAGAPGAILLEFQNA